MRAACAWSGAARACVCARAYPANDKRLLVKAASLPAITPRNESHRTHVRLPPHDSGVRGRALAPTPAPHTLCLPACRNGRRGARGPYAPLQRSDRAAHVQRRLTLSEALPAQHRDSTHARATAPPLTARGQPGSPPRVTPISLSLSRSRSLLRFSSLSNAPPRVSCIMWRQRGARARVPTARCWPLLPRPPQTRPSRM